MLIFGVIYLLGAIGSLVMVWRDFDEGMYNEIPAIYKIVFASPFMLLSWVGMIAFQGLKKWLDKDENERKQK